MLPVPSPEISISDGSLHRADNIKSTICNVPYSVDLVRAASGIAGAQSRGLPDRL